MQWWSLMAIGVLCNILDDKFDNLDILFDNSKFVCNAFGKKRNIFVCSNYTNLTICSRARWGSRKTSKSPYHV